MEKKIIYEKATWDEDHTALIEKETRWDDGSREVEKHALTGSGYGGYGEEDKLTLFIYEDPGEGYAQYGVSWRDLCGHFSVSLHTKDEKSVVRLFKALQGVTGYDPT